MKFKKIIINNSKNKMKFTTLCALAGATSASRKLMSLPVFDSSTFEDMLNESSKMMTVNTPGYVTYSDCPDDYGVFHFDHDKSHNSEIHKGQDIDIHLRGTVDE